MFPVPKKNSNGRTKWYLRYWEDGTLKNVPKKIYPDFWSKKDALKWVKSKRGEKELDFVKRHSDGLKFLKWKNEFTHINNLIEEFRLYHKKKAPNSYQSILGYLERYVIRFFLEVQKENNLKYWCRYHEEFLSWLELSSFKIGTDQTLAYSTKNHCIRAYNNFMRFLKKKQYIEPHDFVPCECFAQHLVDKNSRGYQDIISKQEYQKLCKSLGVSKDFFITLYHTGMRFSELYSLPFNAVHEDNQNFPDFMREKFKSLGKKVYGYILLENQMKEKTVKRDKNGHIARKPLKGRRSISFKDARIIPIMDVEAWNVIVTSYNRALQEFNKKEFISDREVDYLLFTTDVNKLRIDFFKHCQKGFHACRHSFVTNLVGETRDMIITKSITGHKSDAFFRYLHIHEELALKAKKGKTNSSPVALKLVDENFKKGA